MNDTPNTPAFDKAVRNSMIVHGTLLSGVLTFLGVILILVKTGRFAQQNNEDLHLLSYVAAGTGAMMAVLALVMPPKVDAMFRRKLTSGAAKSPLVTIDRCWFARTVISAALLEGAALFNVVVYQLAGRLLSLMVVGALVLLMAALFPTMDRARRWKNQQERLSLE